MEFKRNLYEYLVDWKTREDRMPLILRGARQVGKTTLVRHFAAQFDEFLEFNLEKTKDRAVFQANDDIKDLLPSLFLNRGKVHRSNRTYLLFIDEIQEWPSAINQLRYFYEERPDIHVIASGSLLDHALNKGQKIPVGRVEYAVLHPMNFEEYLWAQGNEAVNAAISTFPIQEFSLPTLFETFHRYALLGGMPRILASYFDHQDISRLKPIFNSLIRGYTEDVEKYASNRTEVNVIRHVIQAAPAIADQRIKFEKFAGSNYKSREVGEAFRSLEKAKLLDLMYPSVETSPPAILDYDKRPRLQLLDTGLMNFASGLQSELLSIQDLNDTSRGRIAQHIVYQEMKSIHSEPDYKNVFWVRQESKSSAEVDLIYNYNQYLIPIEVKSGATGRLRSLHEFMDRCDHKYAVRLYRGPVQVNTLSTRLGKKYQILNLPYFLTFQIDRYLEWFFSEY